MNNYNKTISIRLQRQVIRNRSLFMAGWRGGAPKRNVFLGKHFADPTIKKYHLKFEYHKKYHLKFVRSLQPGLSIMFRSLLWFK
jgi:hypothetical protein